MVGNTGASRVRPTPCPESPRCWNLATEADENQLLGSGAPRLEVRRRREEFLNGASHPWTLPCAVVVDDDDSAFRESRMEES